ncbi:MAG TPA: hypothetical protein VKZ53_15390 [Candidatus Angelobacter sp.]|nr:hypothetical protein [Candidatus Angelobacter sp.]
MAVYKRTYKTYTGALTPDWSRFTVLSRYTFSTLFDSRLFTAYSVACMIPVLAGIAFIYFIHSTTAQALLGMNASRNPNILVDGNWFLNFFQIETIMAFILAAWAVPGMMSRDFANQALQLYLSRPLSRTEYLLGKISVLAVLLSAITWIPGLVLFSLQAELEGHGWGFENLWLSGSIVIAGLLWIALISLLFMAISVWVKWRIAATALMLAIFFVLPGFGVAANAILRTTWGKLIDLPYLMSVIWVHLFRGNRQFRHMAQLDLVPLWADWTVLLGVCLISLLLLNRRLRAKEVERG